MIMKRQKFLSGIALLLIGILFLAAPTTSARIVFSVVGIVLLLQGIFQTVAALQLRAAGFPGIISLIFSIALIALGIFLLLNPDFLIAYSYIVFGLIMISNALVNIFGVMNRVMLVPGRKTVYLLVSVALLALGVVVLLNPFGASDVLMRIIGVALVIGGLVDLWVAFQIGKTGV